MKFYIQKLSTHRAYYNHLIFSNVYKNLCIKINSPDNIVNPWKVKGKVDYSKLVNQFGTELIDYKLISRMEKLLKCEVHQWIKRGIFFTHRGMNTIMDSYEKNEKLFLYTGRGPSSDAMHLGHLIPFLFTKWLHEKLNCPLVIQISDDEKYAFKKESFDNIYKLGKENAKDIIALGFNPKKTFIFSNRDYRLRNKHFEILATDMKYLTSVKEVKKIFGFDDESPNTSVLMYDWPFYQTAAAYYQAYPHIFNNIPATCLVPHAIDQDPYFRLARDLSPKMNLLKPCNIMSKFIPPLNGAEGKMSSSSDNPNNVIFLNDTEAQIKQKIMKYSFSGGGGDGSLSDHSKYGGNINTDISFQYLKYFEEDDIKLKEIEEGFTSGKISCSVIKQLLISKLVPLILSIQEKKSKITDDVIQEFYIEKSLDRD